MVPGHFPVPTGHGLRYSSLFTPALLHGQSRGRWLRPVRNIAARCLPGFLSLPWQVSAQPSPFAVATPGRSPGMAHPCRIGATDACRHAGRRSPVAERLRAWRPCPRQREGARDRFGRPHFSIATLTGVCLWIGIIAVMAPFKVHFVVGVCHCLDPAACCSGGARAWRPCAARAACWFSAGLPCALRSAAG